MRVLVLGLALALALGGCGGLVESDDGPGVGGECTIDPGVACGCCGVTVCNNGYERCAWPSGDTTDPGDESKGCFAPDPRCRP